MSVNIDVTLPTITKRRVTMSNFVAIGVGDNGQPVFRKEEAIDYVRPDHLDAYVADAKTRWQHVTVSEKPDAGPGGYFGQTVVPALLNLLDAGKVYPATKES